MRPTLTLRISSYRSVLSMTFLHSFRKNESGATFIEYSLIAGFIAIVIVGALGSIGTKLVLKFQSVSNGFS